LSDRSMTGPYGETGKVPDYPSTRLALRVWRHDRGRHMLRSLNAPRHRATWVASALADPAGGWPHDRPLAATCSRNHPDGEPVPGRACSCGVYAATDLDVIASYLTHAPVLGVVELGGKVIPAEQGYRAAYARVAAILLIDKALTEPHEMLRQLARAYRVPALVPHSPDPEDYRELVSVPSLAREAEEFLRGLDGSGS
jgi:hypothetical protein